MRTYLDCIPCFLHQALSACRMVSTDEALHERVLRRVLEHATSLDFGSSPPEMAATIHAIVREETGEHDPYGAVKARSNEVALSMLPSLQERVRAAADPFAMAVRIAIAGNIMDFAIIDHVDEALLTSTIDDALSRPLAIDATAELQHAVETARRILYLGDNAGEIVFDRLVLDRLDRQKVIFAVRGFPVINDATRHDAEAVGLPEQVEVIDSGCDVPGTMIERCTEPLQRAFREADVIISKGQGNYETLSEVDRDIFFLLKAKCPMAARDLGCEVGDVVVARRRPGSA